MVLRHYTPMSTYSGGGAWHNVSGHTIAMGKL